MIPMFPFSINNAMKLFTTISGSNNNNFNNNFNNNSNNNSNTIMDSIDEDAIKDRISKAIMQSLTNKRNVRMNAIVVLEYDNDQKRTIVINETMNSNVTSSTTNGNGSNLQITNAFSTNPFTQISSSDMTNSTNVLVSQQPIFPATLEGLQAILNLASTSVNRSNSCDNSMQNSLSFIPIQRENNDSGVKMEKNTESSFSSRKRKSEKPCRIPQESVSETNGLDLTLAGRCDGMMKVEKYYTPHTNNVSIWPSPVTNENRSLSFIHPIVSNSRIKKPPQLVSHKKSSKIFNCNQCKLQFNSLNALCKHTFSDHRAFRCTFCSANFTQRSNLQRHSLKHVGFKPFICNVCSKAYYRKDHLVRHIEVSHPGSDPKSNITVKLSSSECLEYLEKMQNSKMMELSAAMEGEQNNFLLTSDLHMSPMSIADYVHSDSNLTMATRSEEDVVKDTSPMENAEKDKSPDGCESEEGLHISFDEPPMMIDSRNGDVFIDCHSISIEEQSTQ